MSTQIQASQQTYEEYEQRIIQELQPSGLIMTGYARDIASIAWQIEEINRGVEREKLAAKEAWVSRELGAYAIQIKDEKPRGPQANLSKKLSQAKGLACWKAIISGKEPPIEGSQLTSAYFSLCDEASHDEYIFDEDDASFSYWGYLIPSEKGGFDKYLVPYESQKLDEDWTYSKVRYIHDFLVKKAKDNEITIDIMRFSMLRIKGWLDKYQAWDKKMLDKLNSLRAKSLPIELMTPILDKSRKIKTQLSSDLFKEQQRFIELQAMRPIVTIERVKPSLNIFTID